MPQNIRRVLAIPLDEIRLHFERNTRQDLKIVAPELISAETVAALLRQGKAAKREAILPPESASDYWRHSEPENPNLVCLAADYDAHLDAHSDEGPFAISFANTGAKQDEHFHKRHLEIYFSEHAIGADFSEVDGTHRGSIDLEGGGAIVFAPGILHKARLSGLTFVLEIPAVSNDKFSVPTKPANTGETPPESPAGGA